MKELSIDDGFQISLKIRADPLAKSLVPVAAAKYSLIENSFQFQKKVRRKSSP